MIPKHLSLSNCVNQSGIVYFMYDGPNSACPEYFASKVWYNTGGSTCFTTGLIAKLAAMDDGRKRGNYNYLFVIDKTDGSRIKNRANLWCPFTSEQVYEHLEDIRSIIEFEYKVLDLGDRFCIKLTLSPIYNQRKQHYILTRIRYLYEFPYCCFLLDAFKIRERLGTSISLDELFYRIVELFPVITTTPNLRFMLAKFYDDYHAVPSSKVGTSTNLIFNYNRKVLKMSVEHLKGIYRLNSLVNYMEVPTRKPMFVPNENLFDVRFWLYGFENRFPTYKVHLDSIGSTVLVNIDYDSLLKLFIDFDPDKAPEYEVNTKGRLWDYSDTTIRKILKQMNR